MTPSAADTSASAAPHPIAARFLALPRVARWLVVFVAFFLAFEAWDRGLMPIADAWNRRADRIADHVTTTASASSLQAEVLRNRQVIGFLGAVAVPGSDREARTMMNAAVIELLARHQISNDRYQFNSTGGRIARDVSTRIVGSGARIVRATGDLRFDATPEVAIRIIRDLESTDRIDVITQAVMQKSGSGRVAVTLSLEKWYTEEENTRSGSGA